MINFIHATLPEISKSLVVRLLEEIYVKVICLNSYANTIAKLSIL